MKVFNQSLNNVQWITTAYLLAVILPIVLAAYLQRSFSLIIAALFMSDNKAHRDHFNFSEYLLIVLALVALTLAVNNLSSGFASPLVWGGLLVTVISLVIFFKLAKQEARPTTVLKNTSFNLGLLIYTFLQFIQISLTFVIPNLAQLGLKTSALTSGMLLLGSLLSAFFGPVTGRLLDSQGFKKLFLIGSFLAMAGILLYIIFAQKLSIALIVIFHVMFMTGFSMMYNNSMTIGLQQLEVMHIASSHYQGQSKQVVMGSQAAFIVLFIFILLIFACVLGLIKRDKQGLVKN